MNESQDSFQRFLFGRMNKDRVRHQREVEIKKAAGSDRALKEQITRRPTEEQLALIDELVADGQRKGILITRKMVLFLMRSLKEREP